MYGVSFRDAGLGDAWEREPHFLCVAYYIIPYICIVPRRAEFLFFLKKKSVERPYMYEYNLSLMTDPIFSSLCMYSTYITFCVGLIDWLGGGDGKNLT